MATRFRFGDNGIPHFITFRKEWACADNLHIELYFGLETWVFRINLSRPAEDLNQTGELGPTEFNNQFTGFFVNGGRLIGVQDPNHWTMGYSKFVNGLRDAILAYNPTFDSSRAYAMALGGINTLTPTQLQINQQERNTLVSGYTGTKCP